MPPPPLHVPRTLSISFSVSTTLPMVPSSSYASMCLYIDLIEHIVDKVLGNALGALVLVLSLPYIQLLSPLPLRFLSIQLLPSFIVYPLYFQSIIPDSHSTCMHFLTCIPHLMFYIDEAKHLFLGVSQLVGLHPVTHTVLKSHPNHCFKILFVEWRLIHDCFVYKSI